jgi:glycosyltransferase involved in cell wall biosynthesis
MIGKVKVSVCIVTYNHVKFIQQCLDSLIVQKTDFEYEILVSDDCSTDGTIEILKKYAKQFPNLVKPFFQKKNIGAHANFLFVHQEAEGEYVAHIDGDDYALPGKLQSQADFLDKNVDCNIVWHRMSTLKNEIFFEDNNSHCSLTNKKFDILDLIANITIGMNSSKMYRNYFEHKDWIDYYDLDFSFNVLKLIDSNKSAAFTSESIYGVYRSGIGISVTHNYQIRIKIYKWLLRFYKDRLVDRSFINGKILLLVLSDVKHLKKTMFYGVYAFFATLINFKVSSVIEVQSKKLNLTNVYKISDLKV